jgi:uncharacterized membrane protein
MAEFRYGPIELYLLGFEGERPGPGVVEALTDLLESGTIRLLDIVLISKDEDGEVTVTEIEDETDVYGFGGVELGEVGIAADEDIDELAQLVPLGGSAALIAVELVYVRRLAERLSASGAVVLSAERIPAPVVNAILDSNDAEEER